MRVLVLFLLALAPPALAQDKPLTTEQYQSIIIDLCEGARYANHIRYDGICDALPKAFAAQKAKDEVAKKEDHPGSSGDHQ